MTIHKNGYIIIVQENNPETFLKELVELEEQDMQHLHGHAVQFSGGTHVAYLIDPKALPPLPEPALVGLEGILELDPPPVPEAMYA